MPLFGMRATDIYYVTYRLVPLTLSDLEGHFSYPKPF